MFHALFSTQGRLNRAPYWGYSLLMLAVFFVPLVALFAIAAADAPHLSQGALEARVLRDYFVLITAISLTALWPSYALAAKRLQDHNKPGTLAIALLAPGVLYNFASLVGTGADLLPAGSPLLTILMYVSGLTTLFNFVYLGCLRGTVGPNDYGPDRLERQPMSLPAGTVGA